MEISSTHSAIAHLRAISGQTVDASLQQAPAVAAPAAAEESSLENKQHQQQQQQQQQQQEIRELVSRDREVRSHEQAHAAAGGAHAGTPRYELTKGPNGVSYATGGHVSIDVSDVPGDAQATIDKMQTVRRAALAPAQPSAQDRAVAAEASAKAIEARADLRRENDSRASVRVQPDSETSNEQQVTTDKISAYQTAQAQQEPGPDAASSFEALA